MRRLIPFAALLLAGIALASTLNASLTWTAVTGNTDGTAATGVTYNVYQGPTATTLGATPVATGIATTSDAITAGLAPNSQACFAVTAVAGGQESVQSNVSCKTFPASVPLAPVLSVK